jgi:cellulose synthase/poly-beta-1,6-N-acetylglucosamine synthase-like glycosyltransferase
MIWGAVLIVAHAALMIVALVLALLVAVLILEIVGNLRGARQHAQAPSTESCSYVIIIPAHDEVGTIEPTLACVAAQMDGRGRMLVVADNCTDDTASVSAAAGAEVIERFDLQRRGKGYALDYAVRHLRADPPDIVVVLDADCIPEPGAIGRLVSACYHSQRPQQARYDLAAPVSSAGPLARVGTFAWRVRNILRATGLANLGFPCLLMGTGMAFPWTVFASSHLETGHLVEDLVLGLELAAAGQPPTLLPEARVCSTLAPSIEGQTSQRTRWESGHLQVIWQLVPRLLLRALRRGDVRLLVLTLHAAVPPLALLVLLLGGTVAASLLVLLAGGPPTALSIALSATACAVLVLAVYWQQIGRRLLSRREILTLPAYVISKMSIYAGAFLGRRLHWVRTRRD